MTDYKHTVVISEGSFDFLGFDKSICLVAKSGRSADYWSMTISEAEELVSALQDAIEDARERE